MCRRCGVRRKSECRQPPSSAHLQTGGGRRDVRVQPSIARSAVLGRTRPVLRGGERQSICPDVLRIIFSAIYVWRGQDFPAGKREPVPQRGRRRGAAGRRTESPEARSAALRLWRCRAKSVAMGLSGAQTESVMPLGTFHVSRDSFTSTARLE